MPIKFKPSEKNYDRRTGKTTVVHHWMRGTPTKDLLEALEKENTKPKVKHKIRLELFRRKKSG
jgi:hypothetical protein|tara:strand:+ start:1781 stop:1969 length:189 start_codon:yes stop_codon:yes gene_type:complete